MTCLLDKYKKNQSIIKQIFHIILLDYFNEAKSCELLVMNLVLTGCVALIWTDYCARIVKLVLLLV